MLKILQFVLKISVEVNLSLVLIENSVFVDFYWGIATTLYLQLLRLFNLISELLANSWKQRMQPKNTSKNSIKTKAKNSETRTYQKNAWKLFQTSHGAHSGIAAKLYIEADDIMNKPFTLLNEHDLIWLQQIVELLQKKQAFLSELNQKIQSLFVDPDNVDNEIVETEEYDDKIGQNNDYDHGFAQRKTRHSSQGSSFAAWSTTNSRNMLNLNLPRLRLSSCSGNYLDWISFFYHFKGTVIDNDQLTNSLRLQYLKSAMNGEASEMLTSITLTDENFNVAMDFLQNQYESKGLILRAHIHGIVS